MDRGAWWVTVHGVTELDITEELTLLLFILITTTLAKKQKYFFLNNNNKKDCFIYTFRRFRIRTAKELWIMVNQIISIC